MMESLREHLGAFNYVSLTLAGRDRSVVVLRGEADSLEADLLTKLDAALGLSDDSACLRYNDTKRQISKRALIKDEKVIGLRLSGDTRASTWLQEMVVVGGNAVAIRRWLLAPLLEAPVGIVGRGRIICNCWDVSEGEVRGACGAGEGFSGFQSRTHCGTKCGSCVPELKRLFGN